MGWKKENRKCRDYPVTDGAIRNGWIYVKTEIEKYGITFFDARQCL